MARVANPDDKRYQRNEKTFFKAFVGIVNKKRHNFTIRPGNVYKKAGLSRSTFSRHYDEVGEILLKREQGIIKDFSELSFANKNLFGVWRKILLFLVKNREVFLMEFLKSDDRLFYEIICKVKRNIDCGWVRYHKKIRQRIFMMVYHEILGVVTIWIKEGMEVTEVDKIAISLEYLVKTADKRLVKIIQW